MTEFEKVSKEIQDKKHALKQMKEYNRSAWDVYGSELCAGAMINEEEKLQKEIDRDEEKLKNILPDWISEYSGAQM